MDTQKALKAFKEKYQITEQERKSFRLWWILPGMAAAILVAVLIYPRFRGKRSMEGGNGLLAPRGLYASGQFLHNPVPAFFRPFPRKRLPEIQPQSSHGRKSRVFCQA
ncbi:hypothetical protein [Phocaeicola dorei]|uniref:hypothetical protein n=1 Tax=Phocaeicola dorei TaxID=357276 RepID=UPI00211E7EC4|nr:hypothetical protein [Phocaeicola dorei]